MKKLLILFGILFLAGCQTLSPSTQNSEIENRIAEFNQQYSENEELPQLKWLKTEDDTVFVEVLNANYLTQRMGSAGAGEFMKQAVLTLTKAEGMKYVDFSFEEGDHAMPGKYSPEDVADWGI